MYYCCWFILALNIWNTKADIVTGGYEGGTPCYDKYGKAQRCIPQFENAAFGLEIEATNTCGQNGVVEYCLFTKTCEFCANPREHDAHYMTDFNGYANRTWWQSETMYENIQHPTRVNLTLHFGKAFDITYIHLLFHSPRPHSFTVYKKATEDGPWIPFQYYSNDCRNMYKLPDENYVRRGEKETRALCTSEFSGLSPLTGGNVPFSTLEGRPSANQFDYRPEFWEWVSATDILVTLDRLNTFGDEIFKEPKVLKSYYYAISDFNVGARCKCNGHASECYKSYTRDGQAKRVCRCEHKTAGPDCNQCLPFYNDAPWGRASKEDAHECRPCNCNGFSSRCIFDPDLYSRTGHGGRCLECAGNRDGPNCEVCRLNYYLPANGTVCEPCNCDETGSLDLRCNVEGNCICKHGVTGQKCDRCDANYYDFSIHGCKECRCNLAGSFKNEPYCHPETGVCRCKENVEGKQCNSCKLGYFNLDLYNEFGCTPCFCYGHSSVCQSAPSYSKFTIENSFTRGNDKWNAIELSGRNVVAVYNGIAQAIEVTAPATEPVYFVASEKFLGEQRASYNHKVHFKLRIGDASPIPTVEDIIIEGSGLTITQSIFGQGNQVPSTSLQEYKFHLHENPAYGWQPRLATRDFMNLLSNVTSIKIRATYSTQGFGSLDDVVLETARRGTFGNPANWVEICTCPDGYVGQFCESCMLGRRHEPTHDGSFAPCVPCDCNKHGTICDTETGRCKCDHNTTGHNCEKCASGFYGNALLGTPNDCKPCPCQEGGPCVQYGEGDDDSSVICLSCSTGYGGQHCEICSDGYYGDPLGEFGPKRPCQACDCNRNIDPNAIGYCNRTTGECLKCVYNTGGPHCDRCLPGYFGDALSLPKGDCEPCQCYPTGTEEHESGVLSCDPYSGQCHCKPDVIGTNCNECKPGYFNIASGQGCELCQCDPIGSVNASCDIRNGQCYCRPGVTGLHCDKCLPNYYGFSVDGCRACECDPIGSIALQCDSFGQCPCLENVEGRKCDRCKENKYDRQRDCVDCPPCYNLVKDAVDSHRANLRNIQEAIANISSSATIVSDEDFDKKMKVIFDRVDKLLDDVQSATQAGGGRTVTGKLGDLYKQVDEINSLSQTLNNWTNLAKSAVNDADSNVTQAEQIIRQAQKIIQDAMDYVQTDGMLALAKATAKSAEVGQQSEQMSQIARDARALVEAQEESSEALKATADKALNISSQSHDKVKDAINRQKNVTNELTMLNSTLIFMGEKLNSTVDEAKELTDAVAAAYKDALSIYSNVYALNVPSIDTGSIRSNASNITKVAGEISEQADKLLLDNANVLQETKTAIVKGDELLQRATEQQQIADELLADADSANSKAEEAVKLGDKTLREAQQTYRTIQEFDKQVQDSKDKSQESLKQIPEIEKILTDAMNKTRIAQDALMGAEQNAQSARNIAQQAEHDYAKVASNEADKILHKTETAKTEAEDLQKQANVLADRVNSTAEKVMELEKQSQRNQTELSMAKEKVSQAKSNVGDARKQVEKATEELNAIMKELNNLPEIDENSLRDLENRLAAAQRLYDNSQIDDEIEALNRARLMQTQQIKTYQEELDRLQREVDNMDEIRKSLPGGCWKRTRLEP